MTISYSIRVAIQTAIVALASYLCGFQFSSLFHPESGAIGGLWSAISGIVVLQTTQRETWSSASLRVLGTLIGAICSAVYLSLLSFSPIGIAVCIFVTVLICHAVRVPSHARLGAITVVVIMVVASLDTAPNPILSATLRFTESFIGTAIAILIAIIWPDSKVDTNTRGV